jgi:pimeloyl-ACP methyl ester carboxylesterase
LLKLWPMDRHQLTNLCARVTTAQTRVLGVDLFHQEAGQGPPLVLLHGINDSHRTWSSILPRLAQSRRVLALDLPGCGLSGRPDASYSLDWQASVVIAWLEALGLDQVDMVGHSYGGGVAQHMLLRDRSRIRRLGLVAAGGLGREVALRLRLASLPRLLELFGQPFLVPVAARVCRALGAFASEHDEQWYRAVHSRPGTSRALARTVGDVVGWRGQTRHFLDRAIEIEEFPPIAMFWGTEDRIIPYAQALTTLTTLCGATITAFEGCGHFPHRERPAEFARALLAFVEADTVAPVRCVVPVRLVPRTLIWRLKRVLRGVLGAPERGRLEA